MLAADSRPAGVASSRKTTRISEPQLKPGICAKIATPVPPATSAARHQSLSRRNKKTGRLSFSGSSNNLPKTDSSRSILGIKNLGLEIRPEKIIWKGWEPGEEYTRNLTLKNIHVKTNKIKYKAPASRFFNTLFPQVIVLSAGTSFTLPVTFRPLEKEKYDDKIEFTTSQGCFSVRLHALLPEVNLHIPESIHFGLSTVNDTAELHFELKNMSELTANYSWEVPEPFSIIPPSGIVQPKAKSWLRATFHPTSASVFEASVVCLFGDNATKSLKMEGIGKYPHLLVSTKLKLSEENEEDTRLLDFGSVNVHQTVQKPIYLHNLSNVKAPFKISRLCSIPWMDEAFDFETTSGVVPPVGTEKIQVRYTPHLIDQTNIDHFQVATIGDASKSLFQCVGSCVGPNVILSASIINFGLLTSDIDATTRSFQLTNESSCDAFYQFDLEEDAGIFMVDCNSGVLPARQTKSVNITFNPSYCISYRRRAVILIHEQEPLFLELIGTKHSREDKPPSLSARHLDFYRAAAARGLSFYSPDVLSKQLKEGKLILDENSCLALPNEEKEKAAVSVDYPMTEYFDDGHNTELTVNPPHVSLDQISLWIGEVQFELEKPTVCHATLQLTNHTRGKVTVMWIADPTGAFEVLPPTCDIPAMKSSDFRVVFKPHAPNQFYGKLLECYVSYKCMRDYRSVDEHVIFPPWLLTLDVAAHTFNGKNETFYPEVKLSSRKLIFPPATSQDCSYRTLLLQNEGTTPLLYNFYKNKDCFTVKPPHGLSKSKQHICLIRHIPPTVDTFEDSVTLRLNDNETHDESIQLVGTGEQPELLLSNDGEIFFRPTCVDTKTSREYEVKNAGRLPIKFKWVIPAGNASLLSVQPLEGVMHANETQKHSWSFKPATVAKYVFKPTCLTWPCDPNAIDPEDYPSKEARRFKVRVVGEGCEGVIKVDKYSIDFGSVISGSTKTKPVVLYNNSMCDLHFRLSLKQAINSQYGEEPDEKEPIGLKLSTWKSVVPARSKITITALAHPHRRVVYNWSLYYELLGANGELIGEDECQTPLCELTAEGVFPVLSVVDARSSGSGSSVSKTQLWRWFSLDHLNSCLDSDPEKSELHYSVNTRHSATRRPNVYTKSILDFNFGAASVSSEPCCVSMMVKNTGSVPTEWAFLFPKDLELEIDYWAETGLLDPVDLHELHVQDNELFTVFPSRGVLEPGEHRTILLSYKHNISGTHRIPVLLKIENGKEVLINFIGVTVEQNRRYLHFPGTKHVFTPVPIGGPTPPKQLYEMYNGGSMAVMYEVDMAHLVTLETANYEHSVLTCLNPRGEILPGTSANLEWIFSPLESKTYTVDIPIHILGGETALITFEGIGYDTRVMGSSMPFLDQPPEFTSVPSSQHVPVPGQILFMSEERVSFGNVPLFGKARHIVFLSNKSEDRPVTFTWHATSEVVNDVLRIEPVHGTLAPGESIMTKISFCAAGQPSFYDLDLICEVVDEVKTVEFVAKLAAWKEERARQAVEFVITDDADDVSAAASHNEFYAGPAKFEAHSTTPRQRLESILNKTRSPIRLTDSELSKDSAKSEVKSYTTLPPIRFEDPVTLPSNRSRLLRHDVVTARNEWPQPQPPKPFICHLGVTARTHDIAQFRTHFASESNKHFIDRTLQVDYPVPAKSTEEIQYPLTTCDEAEKSMVVSVMSDVIRGLLDDPTFHNAVSELDKYPTPYFQQLPGDEEDVYYDASEDVQDKERNKPESAGVEKKKETRKVQEEEATEERKSESEEKEKSGDDEQPEESDAKGEMATEKQPVETKDESGSEPKAPDTAVKLMSEILRHSEGQSRPESACDESRKHPKSSEREQRTISRVSMTVTHQMNEQVRRSPQFGSILEEILSGTICNIMQEALQGEVLLTVRPRVVALPPSRPASFSHRISTAESMPKKTSPPSGQKRRSKKFSTSAASSQKTQANVAM